MNTGDLMLERTLTSFRIPSREEQKHSYGNRDNHWPNGPTKLKGRLCTTLSKGFYETNRLLNRIGRPNRDVIPTT